MTFTPVEFFIGDTHFGHKNIVKWDESRAFRPFDSIEEHDEELVYRWNQVVRKNDLVWHLGDFAFGSKHIQIASHLNGRKKLVLGNHDHYPTEEYLKYFDKVYGAVSLPGDILLTHVPVHEDQLKRWKVNIHGHTHHHRVRGTYHPDYHPDTRVKVHNDPRYQCVSCEQINLTPITAEALVERYNQEVLVVKAYK